jgi:hypothetical protein
MAQPLSRSLRAAVVAVVATGTLVITVPIALAAGKTPQVGSLPVSYQVADKLYRCDHAKSALSSHATVHPGDCLLLIAPGYAAGETVKVQFNLSSDVPGPIKADAHGVVRGRWTVSANTTAGAGVLALVGQGIADQTVPTVPSDAGATSGGMTVAVTVPKTTIWRFKVATITPDGKNSHDNDGKKDTDSDSKDGNGNR